MKWSTEKLKNHKGMTGKSHNIETIEKMKIKAKLRGNNGISEQLKGKPRPSYVKEKMKATMFKKGQALTQAHLDDKGRVPNP